MALDHLKQLDHVLHLFAEKPTTLRSEVNLMVAYGDDGGTMVKLWMEYLAARGFVVMVDQAGFHSYLLTPAGVIFHAQGGFAGEARALWWKRHWEVVKVIGTIAYSLAVLAVAIWAVCVETGRI